MLLVLVGLAFLGGTTVQALPPSGSAAMARASITPMPGCAETAAGTTGTLPELPHKGITPDCLKLTQCLGLADLAIPPQFAQALVSYPAIAYGRPARLLDGLSPTPVPFPPRSA